MSRLRSAGARFAVAAAFAVGFLWQVLGAVSNLLVLLGFAAAQGRQLNTTVLGILLVGLLIPLAAFAVAVVIGRRSAAGPLALILLAALCASQALGLSQLAFFQSVVGGL